MISFISQIEKLTIQIRVLLSDLEHQVTDELCVLLELKDMIYFECEAKRLFLSKKQRNVHYNFFKKN